MFALPAHQAAVASCFPSRQSLHVYTYIARYFHPYNTFFAHIVVNYARQHNTAPIAGQRPGNRSILSLYKQDNRRTICILSYASTLLLSSHLRQACTSPFARELSTSARSLPFFSITIVHDQTATATQLYSQPRAPIDLVQSPTEILRNSVTPHTSMSNTRSHPPNTTRQVRQKPSSATTMPDKVMPGSETSSIFRGIIKPCVFKADAVKPYDPNNISTNIFV